VGVDRYYTTGQFARKASVSVRTLRYYDRVGLLSPSKRSAVGYRLYADDDLAALQQILALKLLGFSLEEIGVCRRTDPWRLEEALGRQRAMVVERRAHLDAVLMSIDRARQILRSGAGPWDALVQLMEVIQVEQKKDWVDKYFTPEQRAKMEELSRGSYSEDARRKIAPRGAAWTEEDQRRADEQWGRVNAELKRLTAAGADPAGPEARAWAKAHSDLIGAFTQGDPEVEAGLKQFWRSVSALPEAERPMPMPYSEAEQAFMSAALAAYREGAS
jgi:DNA-binding transcriptional MerR regulator